MEKIEKLINELLSFYDITCMKFELPLDFNINNFFIN